MRSEAVVRQWYKEKGQEFLHFYKGSHTIELRILKKLKALLPPKAYILDAGCGAGIPAAQFLVSQGHDVLGIDISPSMLQRARKNVPKATFRQMSLHRLDFPSQEFDAIICLFVLLHLEKKYLLRIFRQFHQILKGKGLLLFSVVHGKEEGYRSFFGQQVYFSAFTKKELRTLLKRTRFIVLWQKDFVFQKDQTKERLVYYLVQKA